MTAKIILGSRGSALALAQTRETRERLMAAWPELREDGAIEIRTVKTTGDVVRDRPLAELGGKGLFIKEVEGELLSGAIDAAVHSMKDMETTIADATILAAVLPREDPRDAFISPHADSFEALPEGARIGTASVRRAALVLNRRPDLQVVMFRGNVDTRLRKLHDGEADATFRRLRPQAPGDGPRHHPHHGAGRLSAAGEPGRHRRAVPGRQRLGPGRRYRPLAGRARPYAEPGPSHGRAGDAGGVGRLLPNPDLRPCGA